MATQVNEARLRLTARDETAQAMTSAARNLERLAAEAERSGRRAEAAMSRQQQRMKTLGAGIGGALGGREAARVLADSFTEFAKADRTIGRIGNTAGKSKAEMAGISRQLAKLADDFAMPVDGVAKGLDALVASGRSLEDSMSFLPAVTAAAQASGAEIEDIATSANALGTSMGFTGQQMTKVFDILVAGGQAGNFELKDMARYLPSLAPLAASVGYKGEEGLKKLVAILQVVRKQTGDAGQAADATREVFSKMGSEELQNRFKEFGVDLRANMDAAAKAGKDLPSTFLGLTRDTLMAAAGAEGFEGAMRKLPLLFADVQLQNGMRALLSQPGAVKELVGELGKVDGTTLKNLANITNDAQAGTQRLANSWNNVQKAIGEALAAARAPEGLNWLAGKLNESAAGFERIAKLGLGGAVKRALARDSMNAVEGERAGKLAEIEGASGPAKARLEAELREIEERLALARGRFERADTAASQRAEGLPDVPELPGPLPDELRPPSQRREFERGPAPQFRRFGEEAPGQGLFKPMSFGDETAQEDTQKQMARDVAGLRKTWDRAFGQNAPGGRFGGLIHRTSLGDGTGTGTDPVGGGYGGSGVPVGDAPGGLRGGTAGAPNMRYGGQGGGGGGGGSGRTPGAISGGSAPTGNGRGTRGAARTGEMMRIAMDQLRREGVPEGQLRQAAAHLVGQAQMESGLDPNKSHDGGTGYGIYGARDPQPGRGRRTDMLRWMKENGYAPNSAEGQMRYMTKEAMSGRYKRTRSILMGQGTGNLEDDTNTITREFESPAIVNRRSGAVAEANRIGPQEGGLAESSGDGAPDTGRLRVKGGPNGQAFAGGPTMPGTIAAARDFQRDGLPGGVSHFSAFNDRFHAGTGSKHALGLAFDTTLKENTREAYAAAAEAARQRIRESGLTDDDFRVIDEKNNPSSRSTGPHLHTQFNSPEAAARYNAWSAKRAEERAKVAAEAGRKVPSMVGASPPGMGPPSLEQGGSGFRSGGGLEDQKARHDQMRAEMEKPIETPVKIAAPQMDRMRERSASQARRETDREFRNARLQTFSDVGVA